MWIEQLEAKLGNLWKLLVYIGLLSSVVTASEKPGLEIGEIVIEAFAPALTGGQKEPVNILETQTAMASVSDTLKRLTPDAPDLLLAPDEPHMEIRSGCLASFLNLGSRTQNRMVKASRAWNEMRWQAVIDALMPVVSQPGESPRKPEAIYFVARSRHYLGDNHGAGAAYEMLRSDYPNHPFTEHALYSLGWIYFELDEFDRALGMIDEFSNSFAASPLTPYVRYLRASINHELSNYAKALRDLEAIISGYPLFDNMEDVQFWIAENHYFLKHFDIAAKNYTLYLHNYHDGSKVTEALYGRAFSFLEEDRHQEALSDFQTLLDEHPDHPLAGDAGFLGGKLAIFLDDPRGSTGFFQRALRTYEVDTPRKFEAQAWIDFEANRYELAAKGFLLAAQANPERDAVSGRIDSNRAEMLYLEAISYLQAGKFTEAAEKFEFLARELPKDKASPALANAGIAWMKLNRPQAALQRLKEALAAPERLSSRNMYMLYLAEILFRLKQYDESIALFEELRQREDSSVYAIEIIRGIAWNYYAQEDWVNAAATFEELIRRHSQSVFHPEALLRRAESLFNNGDYEMSKRGFQQLIDEFPLHPEAFEARLLNARADWIRGDIAEGVRGVRETLRFAPDAAHRQRVRMTLGELYQEQGQYSEAADEYRQAYQEDPTGPGAAAALIKQADNLYNQNEYDRSSDLYRKVIREFPESEFAVLAQYSIGLIFLRQDRLDDYLQECLTMAQSHPGSRQSALALNGASAILVEQNRYSEAAEILTTLRDRYSSFVDSELVRFRLGQTLYRLGQTIEAEKELNDLINLNPTGRYAADAIMELADGALNTRDYAVAIQLFRRIAADFPFHPRRLEAIEKAAKASSSAGQYENSARLWKQLLEESPDAADVFYANLELGRVLFLSGDLALAEHHAGIAGRSTDRKIIAESRLLISEIKENQGDIEYSLKEYLKIGYLYPEQGETVFKAHLKAVSILHTQGKVAQARSVLEKAGSLAKTLEQNEQLEEIRREIGQSGGNE